MLTVLTKSSNFILGPIAFVLGLIMNGIYEFFHLFGIQNIALSIFVFTFIAKSLMLPLTIKQQKAMKLSSRMNPELQKIQAKYKGKKDEASLRKMREETQAVYQKYGTSQLSGCLPLLITLPIMLALYSVINNIPAYVTQVKALYEPIANEVLNNTDALEYLNEIATNLRVSKEITSLNHVIDVLAKLGKDQWDALGQISSALSGTIESSLPAIRNVNHFLGLTITDAPGWAWPGVLIPIFAMSFQFIQGKQTEAYNKQMNADKDNPAASTMSSMNIIMPIMSGIFCIALPIGVGLYWIATSIFTIIQQFFINKYMKKIDVEELIQKSVEKSKGKKTSSSTSQYSLGELAKKQTKSIETVTENKTANQKVESKNTTTNADTSKESVDSPKSISEIANLLKNRNLEKGDK